MSRLSISFAPLTSPGLLARCLTPQLWAQIGVTLVEIEPDGDTLPVRATYQPDSPDLGIGVNPLTYQGRLWYALPDVIAATLLGDDKPPTVTRAIRVVGEGVQMGLRRVRLRGGHTLDPAGDRDPFLVMIEQRARVNNDPDLPEADRKRLEKFLKITANATAYGSLARFDRRDLPEPATVTVHGPDPESRGERTSTPEDPGPFCFPPLACSITAAARLMLAILERLVTDAGGEYVFCDTDSMAIVATPAGETITCQTASGETITALSWETVRDILDRFDALNPYDPELLRPWKVEHNSLADPLWCYAISAKRYALYRTTADGATTLIAARDSNDQPDDETATDSDELLTGWSEHGLGLYLDPLPLMDRKPQLDDQSRRVWIRQAWDWILARAHGLDVAQPDWAERYALTRFTVSSPTLAAWFKGYDDSQPREERIRPGSFGLIAHPNTAIHGTTPPAQPAATYTRHPDRWPSLPWYDRTTGTPTHLMTLAAAKREPERLAQSITDGAIVIDTLATVLGRYTRRPEHKSLATHGTPASHNTTGLLQRRPVTATPATTLLTGKEGNKLTERLTGETTDVAEYRNDYGTRADQWFELVLPTLKDAGAAALIAHGIPRSTAFATLGEPTRPREHYDRYVEAAYDHAAAALDRWGIPGYRDPLARLAQYLRQRDSRRENVRRCEWCGKPIPAGARADARYHSGSCRQSASRARRRIG
jgi:hypothetical protein